MDGQYRSIASDLDTASEMRRVKNASETQSKWWFLYFISRADEEVEKISTYT